MQKKTEQSTSTVTSFTSSAMTVTAGNAIVACMSGYGVPSFLGSLTASDSQSDAYTEAVTGAHSLPALQRVSIACATGIVGGSTTFTVTPDTAAFVSIAAQEYSGLAAAPAEDVATGYNVTSDVYTGAVNPASVNDLYVSCWTHTGTGNEAFTAGDGWTLRSNLTNTNNMPLGSQDLIGSGPQTAPATIAASVSWDAAQAAFQPVGAVITTVMFPPVDFPMADRGFVE